MYIITDLKQNLKKNQIIIAKGRVSKKYNNINALSVKPVAFTKQSIDTENLQIDDKTNVQQPVIPTSQPVDFASIF